MKKGMKIILASLIVTVFASAGGIAYANAGYGSAGALADTEYNLEEMLIYAFQDEYAAQAGYEAVIEKFGEQVPFTNIVKSEENHINRLIQLFTTYGYTLPAQDSVVSTAETLEEIYASEIAMEENNIAMYEKFLKEELPADVKQVFESLQRASSRHLQAFQKALDGNLTCDGTGRMNKGSGQNGGCTGTGAGRGMGFGRGAGAGRGQNGRGSGTCSIIS